MKPLTLALSALLLAGCTATPAAVRATASPTSVAATTATPTPTPSETEPAEPTESDFELKLKVRKKECFGSAGCNVQFRVDVTYVGPEDLEDLPEYIDITYEVKGGDEPFTATIEMEEGKYSRQTEMISTGSAKAKLTVQVTDVESY